MIDRDKTQFKITEVLAKTYDTSPVGNYSTLKDGEIRIRFLLRDVNLPGEDLYWKIEDSAFAEILGLIFEHITQRKEKN